MIKDRLSIQDELTLNISPNKKTFRTKIIFGEGLQVNSKNGVHYLDNVWDEEENETTIVGANYVLAKLFNDVPPINPESINSVMGIGTDFSLNVNEPIPFEHSVSLFGVGIGGAGDSSLSVYDTDYKKTTLNKFIPLRFTDSPLEGIDSEKYYLKKTIPESDTDPERYAYYLKEFDSHQIKNLWKDAEEGEDGSEVDASQLPLANSTEIETFEEIILTISKRDIKEYFAYIGESDITRINELGLFTGIKKTINGSPEYYNVGLFSHCNIQNEMLKYSNGLTIIYRIYTR